MAVRMIVAGAVRRIGMVMIVRMMVMMAVIMVMIMTVGRMVMMAIHDGLNRRRAC
jgi:hypothetical protein